MRTSSRAWLPALVLSLSFFMVACADDDGAEGTVQPTLDQEDEGEPIDVVKVLKEVGFDKSQIKAIKKNAAYWLYSTDRKCAFRVINAVNSDKRPVIKSNSTVAITLHPIGADGKPGDRLDGRKFKISKLTARDFGTLDLARCS